MIMFFGYDPKQTVMLLGLVLVGIGAFGFAIYKTIIGTRLVKEQHPELFVEGMEAMSRYEKKRLYHRVSRKHAMAANGKYWVAIAVFGFAVFFSSVFLPDTASDVPLRESGETSQGAVSNGVPDGD